MIILHESIMTYKICVWSFRVQKSLVVYEYKTCLKLKTYIDMQRNIQQNVDAYFIASKGGPIISYIIADASQKTVYIQKILAA